MDRLLLKKNINSSQANQLTIQKAQPKVNWETE